MDNYYEILQVSRNAEPEVIKAAFRGLAFKYHPDRNRDTGSNDRMKSLVEAYEVLSDPERRRLYDSELGQEGLASSSETALVLFERGSKLLEKQDFEGAVALFTESIHQNSGLARAFNYRGIAYAHLGKIDRAIEDFENASFLDPEDLTASRNLERARRSRYTNDQEEQVQHNSADYGDGSFDSIPSRPICPKCQAPMAIRIGASGPYFSCLCPYPSSSEDRHSEPIDAPAPYFSEDRPWESIDAPAPYSSTNRSWEPIALALLFGTTIFTIIGALSPAVDDLLIAPEGGRAMKGAIFGTIFGTGVGIILGIARFCALKSRKWAFLWSALLLGSIVSSTAGASTGMLGALIGLGKEGGVIGFLIGLLSGIAILLTIGAFWEKAKLDRSVYWGGTGTGLMAAFIAMAIADRELSERVEFGAIWGIVVGAFFGAFLGIVQGHDVKAQKSILIWGGMLGVFCGSIGGAFCGSLAGLTGSIPIAAPMGLFFGAFMTATHGSVICKLNGSDCLNS
jgi:curved DNA-binding protein CbpA